MGFLGSLGKIAKTGVLGPGAWLTEKVIGAAGKSGQGAENPALGPATEDLNYFRNVSRQRAEELKKLSGSAGGYDSGVANRYYSETSAPIDKSYFDASQGMARRGSSAGVPVGAQMAGQAALSGERMGALSQARLKAIGAATAEKSDTYEKQRQALLDQLMAEGAILGPEMGIVGAKANETAAKNAKSAATWGSLGQLAGLGLGFAFGGPAGAMAGGTIGANAGAMFAPGGMYEGWT